MVYFAFFCGPRSLQYEAEHLRAGAALYFSKLRLRWSVITVVQKHILLYWVKWSCYPESSQYIMYSEKGTKIIRHLWQLQDWEKADQSVQSGPKSMDWSDAFMSHPLSLPTLPAHAWHFTVAGKIQHTPPQKFGVAGGGISYFHEICKVPTWLHL